MGPAVESSPLVDVFFSPPAWLSRSSDRSDAGITTGWELVGGFWSWAIESMGFFWGGSNTCVALDWIDGLFD